MKTATEDDYVLLSAGELYCLVTVLCAALDRATDATSASGKTYSEDSVATGLFEKLKERVKDFTTPE